MTTKEKLRLVRRIEERKNSGAILPATSIWLEVRFEGYDKRDFFVMARTAGYNVKKQQGEWIEYVKR